MSRTTKIVVAVSLLVTAAGFGVLAWLLSRMSVEQASQWSGIVQAFAAVAGVPGLVFAVLALREGVSSRPPPAASGPAGPTGGVSQSVSIGPVKARKGSVRQTVTQTNEAGGRSPGSEGRR